MTEDWDEIGYVISSDYRVAVMRQLAQGPAMPSRLADASDLGVAHVSRALQGLRDRGLVELLVPESRKKGRLYGLTEKGANVWEQIETQNLTE